MASERRTITLSSSGDSVERIESARAGRDREVEVDLVDDDHRLEPGGHGAEVVEAVRVAGRIVRRADPDEARALPLGRRADPLGGLLLGGARPRHHHDAGIGEPCLDGEHREGGRRDDDGVAGTHDARRDEPDELVRARAGDHSRRRDSDRASDGRSQIPIREIAVLDGPSRVEPRQGLAHTWQGPAAQGVEVVADDPIDRDSDRGGELGVRGLERIRVDRTGVTEEPVRIRAHASAAGQRSAKIALGRRCSRLTEPPIASIEAWTR